MEKTRLIFLGTGGGRITTITQARATGGWILKMDGEMIHIDPGPGALIRANEYGVDLKKLTCVLVSHCHPDHYTDAEFVAIAMTKYAKVKKGFILGSRRVMEGGGGYNPIFTKYIQEKAEMHKTMKSGDSVKVGRVNITAIPTSHGESEGIGVVFKGSKKIGYASDGNYYKGQEDYFQNCDCLILNCLRPRKETWSGHMNTEQAKQLIEKTRPRLVVLQHFGMKMIIKGTCFKEAEWLERETGIKTIAAKDGMVLEVK